ncbi:uncharacterized protein Gasu_41490 [Galdieria sulphuraria]|uniref:Uncharacterized protein n=1 Tax=Galdieria sulphuraria TaxID=130081 RepID=M2VYD2_GALSU|nr:uncharacterized protein Gasu_41490 [Galdieria sulphuraria]EME28301.1 hypothetical protein Gasu_41490 [Galdieria sulphuraria]|eukprot:XP_005704821.1 hypothetical protein Gasu_41490 [Galdieria sulphuraria]
MSDLQVVKQRLDETSENLEKLEKEVFQVEIQLHDDISSSCDKNEKELQQLLSQCKSLEEYLLQVALQVDALEVRRNKSYSIYITDRIGV